MKILLPLVFSAMLALTVTAARAEETNGVGVTVSKTAIDNNDSRGTCSKVSIEPKP